MNLSDFRFLQDNDLEPLLAGKRKDLFETRRNIAHAAHVKLKAQEQSLADVGHELPDVSS